ncbi:YbhB/YbcL family Raf kinase inhibitor-like protein [Pseudobacteriovorax antillogorgiicola]|uniref:Uncharacterized conserved protein, phosphatidylethanolamine-binding protein (PEBP) family n=1 Tax=Pseudobacteriovorax antillogorgiicola TaxID=1513793 RepID=A0A1Y6CKV3_9BACT|nr:putative Ig domain-containing protein [Pseudobacteriovorax antillogorgiicola]TCS46193.1 phosphatidylethanolamine-binding protein (PEBP) family uncharacterized protein [Pseudobacteriovorax antillogorgiicola]SMF70124.1 Uncharacterized conserved protein, phosphatidylethanolamine-binding protein (PEBP) family [Pseudobacteriovorax antillogorgiicola]
MKFDKKYLSTFIALGLVGQLVACQKKAGEEETDEESPKTEEQQTSSEIQTPEPDQVSEEQQADFTPEAVEPPPPVVEPLPPPPPVVIPDAPMSFALQSPSSSISNQGTIKLRFSDLTGSEEISIYSDAACTESLATAVANSDVFDVEVGLSTEKIYSLYATFSIDGVRSACSGVSVDYTYDATISEISGISFVGLTGSIGSDRTPTLRVDGVGDGDTVFLYKNSNCLVSGQVGFGIASGNSIDITLSSAALPSDSAYNFHARSEDNAGNVSSCTSFSLGYQLDTSAPDAPSSVTLTDPGTSLGLDTTPTFSVAGVNVGDTLLLYNDAACMNEYASTTVTTNPMSIDSSNISSDGTYQFYSAAIDAAGNKSDCSTSFASYTLDVSKPSLNTVTLTSGGGKNVAGIDGKAILTFQASEQLSSTTVTIHGRSVTANNISGNTWQAVYTFLGSDPSGSIGFTIDYEDQAANAGNQVTATTDGSMLNYDSTNYSPTFSVSSQVVAEGAPINLDINDTNSGNDTDNNGTAIAYTCYYDMVADGEVSNTNPCSAITGMSFGTSDGILQWAPDYDAAGVYELKVVGTDSVLDGEAIFTLTVNNTNRPPSLPSYSQRSLYDNDNYSFDVSDASTGNDLDVDGDTIAYSCYYDELLDGVVADSNLCSEIAGLNFNETQGLFSWAVKASNAGTYEFRITGSDSDLTGDSVFEINVVIDISKQPQLSVIGSNTTSYFSSLSDNNQVSMNGTLLGTYQAGDTFTLTTSAGDLMECTGGCFAVTPVEGTAAWTTRTYASTLLSTYMGRYDTAKIVVAAFDQAAYVEIKQDGVTHATGTIPAGTIQEFTNIVHNVGALWIESDQDIAAYVSTKASGDSEYDRDGRVITAAAKTSLAFVSGGGGTPAAVSTTEDDTVVAAYRNDGTNFSDTIDIKDILTVTHTTAKQSSEASAIAVYSSKPTVTTQHADGDGTNASPSLPKSMLSTHFVAPIEGDYASFASFEQGEVFVVDSTNTVVTRIQMTRSGSASELAPYAATYNISSIAVGTRFMCTSPCLGIYEPRSNDDETLMTGTNNSSFLLSSTDFVAGGSLPAASMGNQGSCSGTNNFPNLTWANASWGTKSLAIIVEDQDNNNVHLNLVDVDPSLGSLGTLIADAGSVTFPSGLAGENSFSVVGWTGFCDNHTYSFKVYAMSINIGSAVNDMTRAAFEASYGSQIIDSYELQGTP